MSFSQWPVTEELKEYIINGFNIIKKSDYNYKQRSAALNQLLALGVGAGRRPKVITIGSLYSNIFLRKITLSKNKNIYCSYFNHFVFFEFFLIRF